MKFSYKMINSYFSRIVHPNNKLFINFENNAHNNTIPCNKRGGSFQSFKGNHMIYDKNDMFIGNIKTKRYNYLKNEFCEFYDIMDEPDSTENDDLSNLWYNDLNNCITRYSYKNKKNDLLKHTSMPYNLVNETCDILNLKNLEHFTPFNIPMNDSRNYISKNDYMFGAIEKTTQQSSFINTIYSAANIKKKFLMKFNTANTNTLPVKNVFCVPILPNFNINEFVHDKHILCVIPSNSIQLRPSDHWYDVEYNGILNTYPIAICVFYNEFAYETSPINMCNFLKLEHVINKNLVNNLNLKLNKDILPIRKKKETTNHHNDPSNQEIIYTDASIRMVGNELQSGIGVWFGCQNDKNISQRLLYEYNNDINYCELFAIYMAIIRSDPDKEITIYTDSFTSMKLINEGYTEKIVRNKKYEDIVFLILKNIQLRKTKTNILKVKAHTGDVGNSNADLMARIGVYNEHDEPLDINKF